MNKSIFNCLLILHFVQTILASKILGVFPTPSLSHQVVYQALILELAKRGHELTVITPDPIENPPDNLHQIDVHNESYDIWKNKLHFVDFGTDKPSFEKFLIQVVLATNEVFNTQMNNSNVKEIIQRRNEFDLILTESLFDYVYGIAHVVKAPFIGISSMPAMTRSYEAIGCPTHPVFYPTFFTEKLTNLNFFDKINKVFTHLLTKAFFYNHNKATINNKMKTWFGDDCPSPPDIEKNVDLLIINSNPLISGIRPLVPAVVTTGELHVKPKQPLPTDLQYFLDNSTQGVIYFSLGTNVLSKDLPRELIEVFLDVFSKSPYNILWKFEDTLPWNPDNVRIMKWLPQFDLLSHPNIKLFITQGGQQSLEEAINCAVPLLVIPFMGDQANNAERVEILNIGLRVDVMELTRKALGEKIETITKEARFKNSIVELRRIVNDEPESGVERAVWWKEYIIRHKRAKHLRSPAIEVTWVEYFLIDVVAACLFITFMTISISIVLAKVIIKSVGRLFMQH